MRSNMRKRRKGVEKEEEKEKEEGEAEEGYQDKGGVGILSSPLHSSFVLAWQTAQ